MGLYKNGLHIHFLQSHLFLPFPHFMLFTSCDQTHTLDAQVTCPLPLHFWMNGLQVTCFSPTLLDEWLSKSHASPPLFGWMGHQVTCFSSTLLDEWATKSHASPPHFWMNGLQVTCFSSTLWMNGPPSHMLLLHTLDEWATKSHASPPHFGWMGHQVTCFFPHTLDEWVSLVQPFAKTLNHPTMSPIKYLPTSSTSGVAPWSCMGTITTRPILYNWLEYTTRPKKSSRRCPKTIQINIVEVEKKFCRVRLLSQFSVISSQKELRVMPVGRWRALQQERPILERGEVKHRPTSVRGPN
jgi:hypothetical protein